MRGRRRAERSGRRVRAAARASKGGGCPAGSRPRRALRLQDRASSAHVLTRKGAGAAPWDARAIAQAAGWLPRCRAAGLSSEGSHGVAGTVMFCCGKPGSEGQAARRCEVVAPRCWRTCRSPLAPARGHYLAHALTAFPCSPPPLVPPLGPTRRRKSSLTPAHDRTPQAAARAGRPGGNTACLAACTRHHLLATAVLTCRYDLVIYRHLPSGLPSLKRRTPAATHCIAAPPPPPRHLIYSRAIWQHTD